jgi:predicted AAA+ superfamily ATPase
MAGYSWEGLVINHLAAQMSQGFGDNASLYFYRTSAGAEMDAVIDTGSERIGFEIKLSDAPRVTKGFWNACDDLQLSRAYVVAPVEHAWPLSDKAQVLPFVSLKQVLSSH